MKRMFTYLSNLHFLYLFISKMESQNPLLKATHSFAKALYLFPAVTHLLE